MTRDQLIQKIVLHMDEITPDAGLNVTVDGSDNNPLYALVDGLIEEGMLELYSVAPIARLPLTWVTSANISLVAVGSRNIIRIRPGATFLRIGTVNCSDFQRPITEVFQEESIMGKRQRNKYLMAREAKPVAVLTQDDNETAPMCIDCYSLASDTAVTANGVKASFVAVPTDATKVPTALYPALEWLVASMAFTARGDDNHAGVCRNNAQNLIM